MEDAGRVQRAVKEIEIGVKNAQTPTMVTDEEPGTIGAETSAKQHDSTVADTTAEDGDGKQNKGDGTHDMGNEPPSPDRPIPAAGVSKNVGSPVDEEEYMSTEEEDQHWSGVPYMKITATDEENQRKNWLKTIASGVKGMFVAKTMPRELLKNYSMEMCKMENGKENVRLTWEKSENIKTYAFELQARSQKSIESKKRTEETICMFSNLLPGEEYKLKIIAEMLDKSKKETSINFHTCPEAPKNIEWKSSEITWRKCQGAELYRIGITCQGIKLKEADSKECKFQFLPEEQLNGILAEIEISAITNEEQQSAGKAQFWIGGKEAPHNVHAKRNHRDPTRSVDVSWEEPCTSVTRYEVKILDITGEKGSTRTSEQHHTFAQLMMDHNYYISVQALFGSRTGITSLSKNIKTGKKNRNRNIDISDIGKVRNCKCNLSQKDDNVCCEITWEAPNLGTENENFKLQHVEVKVQEDPYQRVITEPTVCPKNEFFVNLSHGMKYVVEIVALFIDLDYTTPFLATHKETIETDFDPVAKIFVSSGNGQVVVKWPPAKGVHQYVVEVIDPATNVILVKSKEIFAKRGENQYEFSTSPKCSFGRTYIFRVISLAVYGQKKRKEKRTRLGDGVPQEATAKCSQGDPGRSICIAWQAPDAIPRKYGCQLYELQQAGQGASMGAEATDKTSVIFSKLKMNTQYYGVVWVITDNRASENCHTNICKTESVTKVKENAEHRGRMEKLEKEKLNPESDFTGVEYKLNWDIPKFSQTSKNYKITGVYSTFYEKSHARNEKQKNMVEMGVKPKYERYIKLERGRTYTVCIAARYQEIDDGNIVDAEIEEEINAGIEIPQKPEISYHMNKMDLKWPTVHGAEFYNLEILEHRDATRNLYLCQKLVTSHHTVEVKDAFGYGKIRYLKITASAHNGQKTVYISEAQTIGGKVVPTNVTAKKGSRNPRRCIEVQWSKPEQSPKTYTVLLHGKSCSQVDKLQTSNIHATFENVMAGSEFYCGVIANFDEENNNMICYSNWIQTDEALRDNISRDWKHNKYPTKIRVDVEDKGKTAHIYWEPVELGEAYKTLEYHLLVKKLSFFRSLISAQEVMVDEPVQHQRNTIHFSVEHLEPDVRYDITIGTKVLLIDARRTEEAQNSYRFYAKMSKPDLHEPKFNKDEVTFSWAHVYAGEFTLEVKDAHTSELLFEKKTKNISCSCKTDEKLRIGRMCKMRLGVRIGSGKNEANETGWIPLTIGGKDVVRSVTAERNCDKPERCVDIRFQEPESGGDIESYTIRAIPETRTGKYMSAGKTDITFKYLRSGTQYRFEVEPHFRDKRKVINKSRSDWVLTDSAQHQQTPIATLQNVAHSQVTLSHVQGNLHVSSLPGEEHDTVQDYKLDIIRNMDIGEDEECVEISWTPPLFSNNQDNFKVEKYKVTVMGTNSSKATCEKELPSEEEPISKKYSTGNITLKLGQEYEISIKCHYEDIDGCTTNNVSKTLGRKYRTRPCKTKNIRCQHSIEDAKFDIEWLEAKGAVKYKIEIFTKKSPSDPVISDICKNTTKWTRSFTEHCGYGSSFKVRVVSIGPDDNESFADGDWAVIGGEDVPKDAQADKDVESPNTMAIVKWKPPEKNPELPKYIVEVVPMHAEPMYVEPQEFHFSATEGKITGLKPGKRYRFRVMSVVGGKRSDGCMTNIISTKPAPGQVKNLRQEPNQANIEHLVVWDEEEKSNEYRVTIRNKEKTSFQEVFTKSPRYLLKGLNSGHEYEVTVAGGNRDGFGNDSDILDLTPGYKFPTSVLLTSSKHHPTSALLLTFESTEKEVSYRVTLFKKKNSEKISTQKLTDEKDNKYTVSFLELESNEVYFATVEVVREEKVVATAHSLSACTASQAPQNCGASPIIENDIATNQFKVTWDVLEGCSSHQVKVQIRGMPPTIFTVENKHSFDYYFPDGYAEYSVEVRSKNASGHFSDWSNEFTVVPVPPSPKLINVKQVGEKIIASWDKSERASDKYIMSIFEDGRLIEDRKEMEEAEVEIPAKPASEYSFQIRTQNKHGYAAVCCTSDLIHSAPKKGKILSVTREAKEESKTLKITWEEDERCTYEVRISQLNEQEPVEESVLIFTNKKQHKYSCQHAGGRYGVEVRLRYKTACGDWSKKVECQLFPEKVDGIVVEILSRTLKVKWKAAKVTPRNYLVKVYQHDSKDDQETQFGQDILVQPKCSEEETAEVPNIRAGHLYKCVVVAVNNEGQSAPAESHKILSGWEKPKLFMVSLDKMSPSTKASIVWKRPEGAEKFRLEFISENGSKKTFHTSEESYDFVGGTPGATYNVSLFCGCRDEYDKESSDQRFTLAPGPPTDVQVQKIPKYPTSITVRFSNPVNKPDKFDIVATPEDNDEKIKVSKKVNYARIDGLLHGRTYIIEVQSVLNEIAEFPSSKACSDSFQIAPARVGLPVANRADESTMTLSWEHVMPQPDSYIVRSKVDDKEELFSGIIENKFFRKCPEAGTFTYQVAAVNSGGRGEFSPPFVHHKAPFSVTGVVASPGNACPETTLIVRFHDKYDSRKNYVITATPTRLPGKEPVSIKTKELRGILCDLCPGEAYDISVITKLKEMTSKPAKSLEFVETFPEKIQKISTANLNGRLVYGWDIPAIPPRHYIVEWKDDDGIIRSEVAHTEKFVRCHPGPARSCHVRVASENGSGRGAPSDWAVLYTHPAPVTKVRATVWQSEDKANMEVTFMDDRNPSKCYEVEVTSSTDKKTKTTPNLWATFDNLTPGDNYKLKVQACFETLRSEEVFCDEVIHQNNDE